MLIQVENVVYMFYVIAYIESYIDDHISINFLNFLRRISSTLFYK